MRAAGKRVGGAARFSSRRLGLVLVGCGERPAARTGWSHYSTSIKTSEGMSGAKEKLLVAQKRMQEVVAESPQGKGWESLWQEKVTPWEMKQAAPPLVSLLERSNYVPDSAKVLVPGCGSAYDVIALSGKNRFVIGLDISETAAQVARKNLVAHGVGEDKAVIRVADFFTFNEGPFDVIFDYTFLAALPPSMRTKWAEGTDRLLAKNGKLITLIFPLGEFSGGPPYAMSLSLVENLLKPLGFEAIESRLVDDSHPARQGREWMAVWQRKSPTLSRF